MTHFIEVETFDLKHYDVLELEYVGSGQFAKVYKNKAGLVVSFVDLEDKSRFFISQLNGDHVPNIIYLGIFKVHGLTGSLSHKQVYISEMYYDAYNNRQASNLSELFHKFYKDVTTQQKKNKKVYCELMLAFFDGKIEDSLFLDIKNIWEVLKTQKDTYILEFPIFNIMIDKNETVILLDVAFVYETYA